jgi:chemotaxis methyl-accepting protein methylase
MSQQSPKMIRVYSGNNKGATAFFRNRPLLKTLSGLLAGQSPSVLFHAASIGAEPYTFAVHCRMYGRAHNSSFRARRGCLALSC